ncbi:MAG: hypothetical protein WC791_03015 [Candidatus Paceibacterota bacterium]
MMKRLPNSKVYILTSAQNVTDVHANFWKSLEFCRQFYSAVKLVLPGRYKNPTSQWTQENDKNEDWDPQVKPFLFNGRAKITDRLIVLGDAKIPWATGAPLSRMDTLTKGMSGIVGHGNRALRSIATPAHKHPKIMLTTGACTVKGNYTDTKNGILGDFNHCLGAVIIETDGETFYIRELNADYATGSFIDLDMEFTPNGVRLANPALSVSLGDAHQRFILPEVVKATFTNESSIVNLLKPKHIIWHDLLDFHTRNHHHKDNWLSAFGKWEAGKECIRTEIEEAVGFVNRMTPKGCQSVVVSSNHDQALTRWLIEADPRKDPVNARFNHELSLMVMDTTVMGRGGIKYDEAFPLYVENKKLAKPNVRFLRQGQSFVLSNVEYGLHGHAGPNGARGSTKNLSIIGTKVTKGHSHAAEIIDGCYSGGTCTGQLEYEGGNPSAHSNAHVVQYANGKRTIIFIINGRYCLPRRLTKRKQAMLLQYEKSSGAKKQAA